MNEEQYIDEIEKFFKECGFDTEREVIPDECKLWTNPWRVDLIVYHKDIGKIGIEAKKINTYRSGGIFAKAFEQIKKYREKSFNGEKISTWCIAFEKPTYTGYNLTNEHYFEIESFIKYFFNFYEIDTLEFLQYKNKEFDRIVLSGSTKKAIEIKRNSIRNNRK